MRQSKIVGRRQAKTLPKGVYSSEPKTRQDTASPKAGVKSRKQLSKQAERTKRYAKDMNKAHAKDLAKIRPAVKMASKLGRGAAGGLMSAGFAAGSAAGKPAGKALAKHTKSPVSKAAMNNAIKAAANKRLGTKPKRAKKASPKFSDAVRKQAKRAGYFK